MRRGRNNRQEASAPAGICKQSTNACRHLQSKRVTLRQDERLLRGHRRTAHRKGFVYEAVRSSSANKNAAPTESFCQEGDELGKQMSCLCVSFRCQKNITLTMLTNTNTVSAGSSRRPHCSRLLPSCPPAQSKRKDQKAAPEWYLSLSSQACHRPL